MRQGEVHVRMTGSDAAQQALLQGQSDLHRLLASAGATSSSVQVGDQAATFGQAPDQNGSPDGSRREPGPDAPGSASDQPGSDVRRDPSGHRHGGGDPAGRGARVLVAPELPTDRHAGDRTAPQNPSRRDQRRLDVSV
jgi:hypothetical protein